MQTGQVRAVCFVMQYGPLRHCPLPAGTFGGPFVPPPAPHLEVRYPRRPVRVSYAALAVARTFAVGGAPGGRLPGRQ